MASREPSENSRTSVLQPEQDSLSSKKARVMIPRHRPHQEFDPKVVEPIPKSDFLRIHQRKIGEDD